MSLKSFIKWLFGAPEPQPARLSRAEEEALYGGVLVTSPYANDPPIAGGVEEVQANLVDAEALVTPEDLNTPVDPLPQHITPAQIEKALEVADKPKRVRKPRAKKAAK